MHPRQADLLKTASEIVSKLSGKEAATPILWKYTDPEGNEFWLKVKKMTVRSPFSGKTFAAKPERETMGAVGKGLREEESESGPGDKTGKKRKVSPGETVTLPNGKKVKVTDVSITKNGPIFWFDSNGETRWMGVNEIED